MSLTMKGVVKIVLVFLFIVVLSTANLACSCAPKSGEAPIIKSFTASPDSINAGQSATLSWDVSGAKFVSMIPGAESLPAWGSAAASPTTTTTYTLLVTNDDLGTSKTVTITVATPATTPTAPAPSTTPPVTTTIPNIQTSPSTPSSTPATTPSFTTPNLSLNPGLVSNILHSLKIPVKTAPIILDPNFQGKFKYIFNPNLKLNIPTLPPAVLKPPIPDLPPAVLTPPTPSGTSPLITNLHFTNPNINLDIANKFLHNSPTVDPNVLDQFLNTNPTFDPNLLNQFLNNNSNANYNNDTLTDALKLLSNPNAACEQAVFDAVNGVRANNGKAALARNNYIDGLCRSHAEYMASHNALSHDGSAERYNAIATNIPGTYMFAENVYMQSWSNCDGNAVAQAWFNSPPHKVNMLNSAYPVSGMGIFKDTSGGLWFCQEFAGP